MKAVTPPSALNWLGSGDTRRGERIREHIDNCQASWMSITIRCDELRSGIVEFFSLCLQKQGSKTKYLENS